jgi:DNA-binding transcriptional LysR family regulator
VSLTEIGRLYYERCSQILADLDEADRIAGALQSTPRGTLRIYSSGHIMRFLAPVVAEFLALYPDVTIDLASGERMIDLIEEGFDLAIRPIPLPDSSLVVRRLAVWRHVLCCAPRYLDDHAPPRAPADLARHNCVHYAFYPFEDGWRFTGPDGATTAVRVSGNLISGNAETLRVVALQGQGIFLAPGFVIADDLEAGRLIPIMTDYRPVELAINAIYPHRRHLSAKVRGFIDLLARRIVEHQRWMIPDVPSHGVT